MKLNRIARPIDTHTHTYASTKRKHRFEISLQPAYTRKTKTRAQHFNASGAIFEEKRPHISGAHRSTMRLQFHHYFFLCERKHILICLKYEQKSSTGINELLIVAR